MARALSRTNSPIIRKRGRAWYKLTGSFSMCLAGDGGLAMAEVTICLIALLTFHPLSLKSAANQLIKSG